MMRRTVSTGSRVGLSAGLVGLVAWVAYAANGSPTNTPAVSADPNARPTSLEVPAITQCVLTRKCIIAPVPLHPVVAVLVEPGTRVKKDQPLVKLDDDEPQADVRAKQSALENAQAVVKEANRYLAQCEASHARGVTPEQRCHDARLVALKAEADERTAKALLDSAKAELEHYEVQAQIDGVVNRLEVHPGTVARPGTTVWGEIVDLTELDIHCDLPPDQAERVTVGSSADIVWGKKREVFGTAKVRFVAVEADRKTGQFAVLLRVANPEEKLKAGVPVTVRFNGLSPEGPEK